MDEKRGRAEPPLPKEGQPKIFSMKVPGWAVLYEDPRLGPRIGLVEDFFPLEVDKDEEGEEGERFVMLRCREKDRRTIKKIRWDRVTFQVTERRNGDEIEVTKWGYFATKPRTDEEEKAKRPFLYLGDDGFSRGPKLKEEEPAGLQHVFRISKEPAPVGKSGKELKGR